MAKSALLRLRIFWGALLSKIWWEGAQKTFYTIGPEKHSHLPLENFWSPVLFWPYWAKAALHYLGQVYQTNNKPSLNCSDLRFIPLYASQLQSLASQSSNMKTLRTFNLRDFFLVWQVSNIFSEGSAKHFVILIGNRDLHSVMTKYFLIWQSNIFSEWSAKHLVTRSLGALRACFITSFTPWALRPCDPRNSAMMG